MLFEYAVEPQALTADWRVCQYLIEKFGFDRGRLIAQFPKAWLRAAYEASAGQSEIDRKRIVELLSRAKGSLVRSRRVYDITLGNWLANALAQHAIEPFHAIIAGENPDNNASILVAANVNDTQPLFHASHGSIVPRTAIALAEAMRPFLCYGSAIWFVDPFFSVLEPAYIETLNACLQIVAASGNLGAQVQIHYREHDKRPPVQMVEARIPKALGGVIPQGMRISLHGWRQQAGGEDLHARYLLTDRGGLSVESGFSAVGAQETVDVQLLSNAICQARWNAFAGNTAFLPDGPVLEIDSDCKVVRR